MSLLDPFGGGSSSSANDSRDAATDQAKILRGQGVTYQEAGSIDQRNANLSVTAQKGSTLYYYAAQPAAPNNSAAVTAGLASVLAGLNQSNPFPVGQSAASVPTTDQSTGSSTDSAFPSPSTASTGLSIWWIILPAAALILGLFLIKK